MKASLLNITFGALTISVYDNNPVHIMSTKDTDSSLSVVVWFQDGVESMEKCNWLDMIHQYTNLWMVWTSKASQLGWGGTTVLTCVVSKQGHERGRCLWMWVVSRQVLFKLTSVTWCWFVNRVSTLVKGGESWRWGEYNGVGMIEKGSRTHNRTKSVWIRVSFRL